jgi:hypothetical protein
MYFKPHLKCNEIVMTSLYILMRIDSQYVVNPPLCNDNNSLEFIIKC